MPYKIHPPDTVTTPKTCVSDVKVIYNGGDKHGDYSIARLKWNGKDVIGIRWNISEKEAQDPDKKVGKKICLGEPNSRGYPTWFILPKDFLLVLAKKDNFYAKIDEILKELS